MTNDHRRLVLVVDTDERFIDETRALLASERVVTVRSLDEAVEIVLGGRVDLVLLGPAFGSEVALDHARRLLEADASTDVAVVAEGVTNRLLKTALKGGFADVLATPLSGSDVADLLRSLGRRPGSLEAVEVLLEPADPGPPVLPIEVDSGPEPQSTDSVPRDVVDPTETVTEMTFAPAEPRPIVPPAPQPPTTAPSTVVTAPVVPDSSVPPNPSTEFPLPRAPQPVAASPVDWDAVSELLEPAASSPPSPAPPPPPTVPPPVPPGDEPEQGESAEADIAHGFVIAVMAGKGGSGKSIVATNLALALGMRADPERVAIVDADLQFGDVALLLQLDPVRTLDDVVGLIDSMSDERLDAALLRHESGVRVLPAPLLPVRAGEIDAKDVVVVVERLRSMFDVVVVDTGPVFDDGLIAILEQADRVVAVVDMDLPSVKNAKVALDGLRRVGFTMDRVRVVVNRANSKARLDLIEVERSVGLRVRGTIPSDRLVPQSVNEGIPVVALSPRSRVARSFHALAESLDPAAARERLTGG